MRTPLPLLLLLGVTACGPYVFTSPTLDLAAGSTSSVSLSGPATGPSPTWELEPVAAARGLTVSVGGLPPNPKNLRGRLIITASADAPLGRTVVTVKAEDGVARVEVNVTPAPLVKLDPATRAPTPIAANTTELGDPVSFVWRTTAGQVMQREAGVDLIVPGLRDVRSVGAGQNTGFAVTDAGVLWKWSLATPVPEQLLEGVRDIEVGFFVALALKLDGSVVDLRTMMPIEGLSDVVSIRSSGFTQQLSNGGGTYVAVARYFLTRDGVVESWVTYDYSLPSNQAQSTRAVLTRGAIDVTGLGFTRDVDGQVFLGNAFLHELPVRKIESPPRTSTQFNATTSGSAVSCYSLFDDGALWLTGISKTFGENQQGAPTFATGATQLPVRAPGDVDVEDFFLLGNRVLAFSPGGALFLAAGDGSMQPADFPGLR